MTDLIEDAIGAHEKHLRSQPDDGEALHNLSVLYVRLGQHEKALAAANRVTALMPEFAEGWLNFGNLNVLTNRNAEAISAFRKATELAPQDDRAWYNLGNMLARTGQRLESIVALEHAHSIASGNANILASLALAYRKQGRLDDAVSAYEKALALDPGNALIHSNLLVASQYLPSGSDETLYAAHQAWNDNRVPRSTPEIELTNASKRPLKIGYVSADFRTHPIGFFLSGVLAHHHVADVISVCLSDTAQPDAITNALQHATSQWVDIRALDDDAFIETVRRNEIDILVDLSGHLSHNRLTAFARRAAPVQATWAGYVGTTGVAAMDWLIADSHHTPDGYERWASERIVRLPHDYICYRPPVEAPPVMDLPSDTAERVTFGCFNNLVKVNGDVLALWAKVLAAVPGSRLILKCADLDQPDLRDWVRATMAGHGIDTERIDLREKSPHVEPLRTYGEIDIALDPFPYSGGLTTLEALWMGVPVITKTGNTFAGRHSTSHLNAVGLTDWIVKENEAYVALAQGKANDKESLRALRQTLRDTVAASPICDAQSFTRSLENAYREMWAHACTSGVAGNVPRVMDIAADS